MAILTLRIQKYWLDEIMAGRKKTEYRDIKKYYESRIENKDITEVLFIVGYAKDAKRVLYKVTKIKKNSSKGRYEIRLGKRVRSLS